MKRNNIRLKELKITVKCEMSLTVRKLQLGADENRLARKEKLNTPRNKSPCWLVTEVIECVSTACVVM